MKTIEVMAVWQSEEDKQLKDLGIESEDKDAFTLITLTRKYIRAFHPSTDFRWTQVWMGTGDNGYYMINMPYEQFKELYHSTKMEEVIE